MMFLAPALLFGTLLASAPIIIHLLNKRKFRRLDWAPMEYLKLTIQANRRRLQLEHWLLLLLRALAVIVLFLAVARPVLAKTGLGGLLGGGGQRVSRVIVLDDSMSMALRDGADSAFDRARDALAVMLEDLGNQDNLTVLTTSSPDEPLLAQAAVNDIDAVIQAIRASVVTDTSAGWAAVIDEVDRTLQASAFPLKEVTIVTDRQAGGWSAGVTDAFDRWATDGVSARLIDVSGGSTDNARVAELALATDKPLVGETVRFTAVVRRDGSSGSDEQLAQWTVNGETTPVPLPALEPGRPATIELEATFTEAGPSVVSLTLPDDALPNDNTRRLVVDVASTLAVELVDGAPGASAFTSATDYLAVAFTLGQPWSVDRLADAEWAGRPVGGPDVVVLADVAALDALRVAELREMVEAGLGVVIFLGDGVDVQAYNEALYAGGAGLVPAAMRGVTETTDAVGLTVEPLAGSPLAEAAGLPPQWLAEAVPAKLAEFADVDPEAVPDTRVLATWNDGRRTLAVVERTIGAGRVLVFNMTADKDWLEWPSSPAFMITARAAVRALAAQNPAKYNRLAGAEITRSFEAARAPTRVRLTAPDPEGTADVSDDERSLAVSRPADARPSASVDTTNRAGVYSLLWNTPGIGDRVERYAVNPDPAESDLTTLTDEQLIQLGGGLEIEVVRATGDAIAQAGSGGRETWRTFVLCLIAMLVGETALAAWVDRDR